MSRFSKEGEISGPYFDASLLATRKPIMLRVLFNTVKNEVFHYTPLKVLNGTPV